MQSDKIDVEATTRAWLAHCWTNPFDVQAAGRALALIDQLTAERDKALAWAKEQHKCADGYAARAEQAEASLADALAKVEAMQGAMSEAVEWAEKPFADKAMKMVAMEAVSGLRPHLPAKVEPNPNWIELAVRAESFAASASDDWTRASMLDFARKAREKAIAARGGTIFIRGGVR